jgi:hypothetical protein
MNFVVDLPLGSLTKWLRILGFDVVQIRLNPKEPNTLPTPQPDTVILSRQSPLAKKSGRPDLIILESEHPEAQLMEICHRLRLPPDTWEPLHRCVDCNKVLLPSTTERVEGRVPDFISQKHHQFFECPQCRRIFWEGSHQQRIRRRLQDLQNRIGPG